MKEFHLNTRICSTGARDRPALRIGRLVAIWAVSGFVSFAAVRLILNNSKHRVVPITDGTLISACHDFRNAQTMSERKQAAVVICEIESKFIETNACLRHSLHDFVKLLGPPINRADSYGEYVVERNGREAYYQVMVFRGYWREDVVDEVVISDAVE